MGKPRRHNARDWQGRFAPAPPAVQGRPLLQRLGLREPAKTAPPPPAPKPRGRR